MLVLSRKPGESIRVGDEIVIEIRRVEGNRVTLAIDAPKHVHILRGELKPFADEFAAEPGEEPYRVEAYRIPRDRSGARRVPTQLTATR